jgi:hypothetical protein
MIHPRGNPRSSPAGSSCAGTSRKDGIKPEGPFGPKTPVHHCLLFASLPEQSSEQLEPSGIRVPGTGTCFVPSFDDGQGLTVIGKIRGAGNLTFLIRENFQSCRQPLYLTHSVLFRSFSFFLAILTLQTPQRLLEVVVFTLSSSSRDLLPYFPLEPLNTFVAGTLRTHKFLQRHAVLNHTDSLTPTNIHILLPFSPTTSQLRLPRPLQ